MKLIYNENYGTVSHAQLAAYRKFNVSPSDHWDLIELLGEDSHSLITQCVKEIAVANDGYYNPSYRDLMRWRDGEDG